MMEKGVHNQKYWVRHPLLYLVKRIFPNVKEGLGLIGHHATELVRVANNTDTDQIMVIVLMEIK